ncbi:class I SAM-dependent methyltransferase [Flavobacterium sp.]|uniref:class I SAM-dependent methyltransferase n=1 Tax=Flavobacterium sp. TaxID=239 RepID=UPI0039E547EF
MRTVLSHTIHFEDRLRFAGAFWKYMDAEFEHHLNQYLVIFERYRNELADIPSPAEWELLPFGTFARDKSWKWRRQSLREFKQLTKGKTFRNTLEIGPWNGWLTQYLAQQSEAVIGIDYFSHPYDGFGNIQKRADNITAVQCNVEAAGNEFKPQTFDLIVLNHCLAYTQNPVGFIQSLIPLLTKGGRIISLGNTWFGNPQKKKTENETAAKRFRESYHIGLYIGPVKGYLDRSDIDWLQKIGFLVKNSRAKLLQNLYARMRPEMPTYITLTYQNG